MSLLLDALKKAADDKQKASQNKAVSDELTAVHEETEAAEETAYPTDLATESEVSSSAEVLTFTEPFSQKIQQQEATTGAPDDNETFTLDLIDTGQSESVLNLDESEVENTGFEPQVEKEQQKPAISNNNVSDEALSLLIHKTNRDAKISKRIIVLGILLASLAVLVSGGIYYYFDMQAEIASLERKHLIAMQVMRSKTSDDKVPEKSEIIRSFVNKSDPEDKVKLAKKHIVSERRASEKHTQQNIESKVIAKKQANIARNNTVQENTVKNDKSVVSIQRTNKSDPLGEKLGAAWLAYESGQYDEAEMLYAEVLHREKNNRDALLGLGAIAINKKDTETAKRYYFSLLKQDPRDPIAAAGIASLHSDKTSFESDEEFLLTMLESNPNAAHLNFALGNIYAQKGEWKAAQQSYFNAWQQNSESADYVFNLAISMEQLGKPQQAIKFYKDSLLKSMNKQVSFSREVVQQRIKVLSDL